MSILLKCSLLLLPDTKLLIYFIKGLEIKLKYQSKGINAQIFSLYKRVDNDDIKYKNTF